MHTSVESHAEKLSQDMRETGAKVGEALIRGAQKHAIWYGLLSAGGAITSAIIDVMIIPRMAENLQIASQAVRRLPK